MNADEILRDVYLPVRSDLITIAAALDRIDAGESDALSGNQPAAGGEQNADRVDENIHAKNHAPADDMTPAAMRSRIDAAIAILNDGQPRRAERIQQLFSRRYEADWSRRFGLKLADAPESS